MRPLFTKVCLILFLGILFLCEDTNAQDIWTSGVICEDEEKTVTYYFSEMCGNVNWSIPWPGVEIPNENAPSYVVTVKWPADFSPVTLTASGCGSYDRIRVGKNTPLSHNPLDIPLSVPGDPEGIIPITYADEDTRYMFGTMSVLARNADEGGAFQSVAWGDLRFTNSVSFSSYYGKKELEIKLASSCGDTYTFYHTVDVIPDCAPSGIVTIHEDKPYVTKYDDGVEVTKGRSFNIDVSGVQDFSEHYEWTHDGGSDITFSGNTFTINSDIGSYRIEAEPKAYRKEYCPAIEPLVVFVDGRNFTVEQTCSITLPDQMGDFGFDRDEGDPALSHFRATVKSSKHIVIKPGMVLESGAELILEYNPIVNPDDPDKEINYIEHITNDETGKPISETRQYFDEMGRPTQTQTKDLATGVVFATETLYDSYGRAVVQTLPAPVSTSTIDEVTDECGDKKVVGDDMQFHYKENFVTSATGVKYNHTDFDLSVDQEGVITSKEENPAPVLSEDEGTLGWYYSSNNGTSTNPLLNEPMTPTTAYPYSRTIFHRDGSGEVKSAAGPGEAFKAGSGNLPTQNSDEVVDGDPYLTTYFVMAALETGVSTTTAFEGKFFKSISWDDKDRKSESYQDLSGNSIMSLYYGDQNTPIIKTYQFYDVAGRLKASISPNGIAQFEQGIAYNLIDKTTYTYNPKGWLVEMQEPDAGITKYIYRKDGSIRFSQNAQQKMDNTFSYTNYDRSGRPLTSGEYLSAIGGLVFDSEEMKVPGLLESRQPDGGLGNNEDAFRYETFTAYDSPVEVPGERQQRFVMGNVSWSQNDNTTTWYSYDEIGRVEWVVQEITGLGVKTIDYLYGHDGNVRHVAYQKGDPTEDFYHYYTYDANGRLAEAFTATEPLTYNSEGELTNTGALKLQATYEYYLHGPLKRVVLADDLQGIDYVYTITGALKAINHADPDKDPGGDGLENDKRKDLFGMTLDYYPDDYTGARYDVGNSVVTSGEALYNGNIKAQSWHVPVDGHEPKAYKYEYDERHQLKKADFGAIQKATSGTYSFISLKNDDDHDISPYDETISSYDKNGNIEQLSRNGGTGKSLADYVYDYSPEEPGAAFDNKLKNVTDDGAAFLDYEYNAIGQMISQTTTEGEVASTMYVDYDVTGKVLGVYTDDVNGEKKAVTKFTYDDRGFRLSKTSYGEEGEVFTTWYVRDASGQVLSTYYQEGADGMAFQTEVPVYGAGRIGLYKPMIASTYYELTDHLGNVRAVIGNTETVTYMATMETEISENGGDPAYAEHFEEQFFQINKRAPVSIDINHTPAVVTLENPDREFLVDPNQVIRLNNKVANHGGVDGGIMLRVSPGDKISAEVYAKFADFNKNDPTVIPAMLGHLVSAFEKVMPTELALEVFDVVDTEVFAAFPARQGIRDDQPMAFLNILFYDNNFTLKGVEVAQISAEAGITETLTGEHERLEEEFDVTQGGWVYIYVSNENNQNMEVYFDDLKVTHEYGDIVAGADYYPFGLAMDGREVTREDYRYGYQGQFAEKDEETGWNHFELRQYDARIGRWTTMDPEKQYWSPYNGNGNNPVRNIDPTGGENPIYGINGEGFLGVDDRGLQGEAIFMDPGAFSNGMAHSEALRMGFTFSELLSIGNGSIAFSVASHYKGLQNRPDWDGFVTVAEGIAWAKAHPNALKNPTADNRLYLDAAKYDYGSISTSEFAGIGQLTPVNLFSTENFRESGTNYKLRASVYALGRVNMVLVHKDLKTIRIVNDNATDYDWNRGGGFIRDSFIVTERITHGLNDTHGFKTFYYGLGTLRR